MPKFDFNNNRYARLWTDSDVRFLRSLIDESDLLRTNYGWWKTQFTKASNATPVAADGTATFTVQAKDRTATPMMDMRALLAILYLWITKEFLGILLLSLILLLLVL